MLASDLRRAYYDDTSASPRPGRRGKVLRSGGNRSGGGSRSSFQKSGSKSNGGAQAKPRKTIAKAKYSRTHKNGTKAAKGAAKYYMTRPNEHGDVQERKGFTSERDELSRRQAYRHIQDAAEHGTHHYRLILSPQTVKDSDGVDMEEWTRETMNTIQTNIGGHSTWMAVVHGGETAHSNHAHAHVILTTDRKLERDDFATMRHDAALHFNDHLEARQDLEHDYLAERLNRPNELDLTNDNSITL